jgi:hypothetical protein
MLYGARSLRCAAAATRECAGRALVGNGLGGGLRRFLNNNKITGTLPASLSALTMLNYLCAAPPPAAVVFHLFLCVRARAQRVRSAHTRPHLDTGSHTLTQTHTQPRTQTRTHTRTWMRVCFLAVRARTHSPACSHERMRTRTHARGHTWRHAHTHIRAHRRTRIHARARTDTHR